MVQTQDRDQEITGGWIETALLFVLPGIIQGIGFWWLIENGEELPDSPFLQFALMFTLVAPTAWFLAMTTRHRLAAAAFALALGALTGVLFAFSQSHYGGFADDAEGAVIIAFWANALICYIAVPFFRTVIERAQGPTHYPSLFEFAWNLPVILVTAAAFVGVVWLVLALWMALFATIGIDFFRELFTEPIVAWVITCAAIGLAVHTVREREGVILAMRNILFALLKLLAPVVALATALYLVAGGVQGLSALEVGDWSLTVTMVCAITAGVVLTNAVLGDAGTVANPLLRWVVRIQSLILPFLAAIAVYAIWVRLEQHGVTVARVYAAIIVAFACAYALVYAIGAVLAHGNGLVRQANIYLAGGVFVVAVLVQTPVINPYQMTVDSQYARLQSGKTAPEDFDFQYFRWEMGTYGEKMFSRIEADPGLPDHDYLVSQIETYRDTESKRGIRTDAVSDNTRTKFDDRVSNGEIVLLPERFEVGDDLFRAFRYSSVDECVNKSKGRCIITKIDRPGMSPFYVGIGSYSWDNNGLQVDVIWAGAGDYQHDTIKWLSFETHEERDAYLEKIILNGVREKQVTIHALDIAGETVLYSGQGRFELLAPQDADAESEPTVEEAPQE